MRDAPPIRRGRARPVADAPVGALVADAGELARDWLLALLASAPLEEVGRVPAGELAAQAPPLCAAMARALADDGALDDLAAGETAAAAGRMAGASDPAGVAGAVEALRGVLWAAALAAVQRPDPALVAALADRLATVAATVTGAALAARPEPRAAWPPQDGGEPQAAPGTPPSAAAGAAPVASTAGDAAPAVAEQTTRPDLADPPPPGHPEPVPRPIAVVPGAPADGHGELRARDLRPRIADGDHLELLEQVVAAHLADRRTLAVLLVELDGVERLLAADFDGEVRAAIAEAEAAVEAMLRPGDAARREGPGRIWVALAGTGPAGARALAMRVAAAVERDAAHRDVPLTASVGTAVFPVEATDGRALADRAEDALFSARAAGTRGVPPGGLR